MDAQVPGGLPPVHPDLRDVIIEGDLLHPKIKKYQYRRLQRWTVGGSDLLRQLISLELVECPQLKQLGILSETTLKKLVLSACSSLPIVSKEDLAIIRSTPQDVRISQVVTFMQGLVDTYGFHIVSKIDWDLQHGYDSQELRNWLKKAMDIAYQNPQEGEVVQLVLPPSLERLVIRSCPLTHSSLGQVLQSLTSLKYLELCNIVSLTSLPSADVLKCLTMLEELYIKQCWFLTSLGGLQALGSLRRLFISYCPSLSAEAGNTSILPSSLEDLMIEACYWKPDPTSVKGSNINLFVASLQLGHLESLQELSIKNCPNIDSLLGLQELNNLKKLILMGCPQLGHAETMLGMLRSPLLSFFVIDAPSLLMLLAGGALASLQHLWIEEFKEESFRWEELEQVFPHLTSLEALLFARCSIRSLPNNLRALSSLRSLSIVSCPNITALPDLLPLLRRSFSDLDLRGRNSPELENQGEYWRERLRSPYFRSCRASRS